jgi:hypothetical protein
VGRNFIDFGTIGGAPQGNVMCAQNAKFDRRACRSVEPQVIAHQFVTSALYDLRFGKDRRYLSTGLLGQIVGGFRVNGILTLRSACRSSSAVPTTAAPPIVLTWLAIPNCPATSEA